MIPIILDHYEGADVTVVWYRSMMQILLLKST